MLEKPVRTFVFLDGMPCLIADKDDDEYKLVVLDRESPRYVYASKKRINELPLPAGIEKPTPVKISRLCNILDTVYILWKENRFGVECDVITYGFYLNINHAGTMASALDELRESKVISTNKRKVQQIFYFDEF